MDANRRYRILNILSAIGAFACIAVTLVGVVGLASCGRLPELCNAITTLLNVFGGGV